MVLIVFTLVDLVKMVPMAGLGGLLLVVGYQNIQPDNIRTVWAIGLPARLAMGATFAATLFLPLQFAILIGVALSFLLTILRLSNRIQVRELRLIEGGFPVEREAPASLGPDTICVLRIRGSLFFATVQTLEAQLPAVETARGATLILILRDIDDLGSTMIRLLTRYATNLQRAGGTLKLTGVNEDLWGQLERTGLLARLGADNIYREQPELGAALNIAIRAAREKRGARAEQV
ncbi:STAS domain-containing protein [Aliiruegeria lutimaris]|uniref:Anti-anti-sigma factor n=1 Tax=Aliiruegeria lutimaris TaxID=571298 RepID=A0A1G9ADU3_9RHOB|nr:STAS domain-containing protein [Aliiruegeria lutimaris]SDK25441.1 anti-anti-sigma factor [Aliiruegeria lutimaris]